MVATVTPLLLLGSLPTMHTVFTYFFVNHSIIDSRLKFSPDYWQLFNELMPGLEYLIFAGVFSFGLKLKQEQDLTI